MTIGTATATSSSEAADTMRVPVFLRLCHHGATTRDGHDGNNQREDEKENPMDRPSDSGDIDSGKITANSHGGPETLPQQWPLDTTIPIYFREDWSRGIGGGLWSTGRAMSLYLGTTIHARTNLERVVRSAHQRAKRNHHSSSTGIPSPRPFTALELGSGNGLLAMCLTACALTTEPTMLDGDDNHVTRSLIDELVVTDTAEHLPLICQTIHANGHIADLVNDDESALSERSKGSEVQSRNHRLPVRVMEYSWGHPFPQTCTSLHDDDTQSIDDHIANNCNSTRSSRQFDLIIGTDLAYRTQLYQPLIKSFQYCAHDQTVILLGVTMTDTTPDFFRQLHVAGFKYERMADHLLDPTFRCRTFGIFKITKTTP